METILDKAYQQILENEERIDRSWLTMQIKEKWKQKCRWKIIAMKRPNPREAQEKKRQLPLESVSRR